MNDRPLVSVCIANFNGEHLLRSCIDSVLAQSTRAKVEIIVHDDASTDSSIAMLERDYPAVRLIKSESNVGFCVSNNRMVAEARGEFVLLLNNDAALLPDAIETLAGMARFAERPSILTLPQYDWESGSLVDRGCLLDPFFNPIPNLDNDTSEIAYGIGACLWMPRDLWEHLGGFPEQFESVAEDMYICLLGRLAGATVSVPSASGYRHRQGASLGGNRPTSRGLSSTYRRRLLSERNKTLVLAALTPGFLLSLLLPLHVATLLLEGTILAIASRSRAILTRIYLAAVIQTWSCRPLIRQLRKKAKDLRVIGWREHYRVFRLFPQKLKLFARYGIPRIS